MGLMTLQHKSHVLKVNVGQVPLTRSEIIDEVGIYWSSCHPQSFDNPQQDQDKNPTPPQVMTICAVTRRNPEHECDGNISTWHVCAPRSAEDNRRQPVGRRVRDWYNHELGMVSGMVPQQPAACRQGKDPLGRNSRPDGAAGWSSTLYRQRHLAKVCWGGEATRVEYQPCSTADTVSSTTGLFYSLKTQI